MGSVSSLQQYQPLTMGETPLGFSKAGMSSVMTACAFRQPGASTLDMHKLLRFSGGLLSKTVCSIFHPANCLNRNIQLVPLPDNSGLLHIIVDAQAVSSVTGEASSPFHSVAFHSDIANPSPRCRVKSQARHNKV